MPGVPFFEPSKPRSGETTSDIGISHNDHPGLTSSPSPTSAVSALVASNGRIDMETKFVLFVIVLIVTGYLGRFALDAQHTGMIATIATIVVMAVVASGFAHFALFRPLRQLVAAARAVEAGDFKRRLRFERRDEIGNLAVAMDALCDQLEAAEVASHAHLVALDQLRHSDRIATLGRLASSVAHELGNPLSVIELRAQLITSGDADTIHKVRLNAAVIVEQSHRMTGILDQILSFARMQPAKITRLDLGDVLRHAISLSEHTSKKHKTQIVLDVPQAGIELDGDANKLLQVVINLIVNGVHAMPDGGTLRVTARDEQLAPLDNPEGPACDFVCIDVADHGIGIARNLQSRVFEPFFSTKSSDGGTGLGLSVAQGIAREHDGWITVESELGSGSSFKVHLPRRGTIVASTP